MSEPGHALRELTLWRLREFFREPDQHIGFEALGWLTRGQELCLPMMALGIFLLVFAYRGAARGKQENRHI